LLFFTGVDIKSLSTSDVVHYNLHVKGVYMMSGMGEAEMPTRSTFETHWFYM